MADVVSRNRPRLNTTVAESTLTKLGEMQGEFGLPNVGVTIDFLVSERERLIQALRATASTAYPFSMLSQERAA